MYSQRKSSTVAFIRAEESDTPMDETLYAINITYSDEGYIDDSDAQDIDYDDLLETIQEDAKIASEQRVQLGYEPIAVVGWAYGSVGLCKRFGLLFVVMDGEDIRLDVYIAAGVVYGAAGVYCRS